MLVWYIAWYRAQREVANARFEEDTEKSKARQIVVTQDVTSPATSELGHDRQHPTRLLLRLQPDLSSELAIASYLFSLTLNFSLPRRGPND